MVPCGEDPTADALRAAQQVLVAVELAALKANHGIGAARQPVHDLAFAFVAPLGTDHRHIGQSLAFPARE